MQYSMAVDIIESDNVYCTKCGATDDRYATDDNGLFCYPASIPLTDEQIEYLQSHQAMSDDDRVKIITEWCTGVIN